MLSLVIQTASGLLACSIQNATIAASGEIDPACNSLNFTNVTFSGNITVNVSAFLNQTSRNISYSFIGCSLLSGALIIFDAPLLLMNTSAPTNMSGTALIQILDLVGTDGAILFRGGFPPTLNVSIQRANMSMNISRVSAFSASGINSSSILLPMGVVFCIGLANVTLQQRASFALANSTLVMTGGASTTGAAAAAFRISDSMLLRSRSALLISSSNLSSFAALAYPLLITHAQLILSDLSTFSIALSILGGSSLPSVAMLVTYVDLQILNQSQLAVGSCMFTGLQGLAVDSSVMMIANSSLFSVTNSTLTSATLDAGAAGSVSNSSWRLSNSSSVNFVSVFFFCGSDNGTLAKGDFAIGNASSFLLDTASSIVIQSCRLGSFSLGGNSSIQLLASSSWRWILTQVEWLGWMAKDSSILVSGGSFLQVSQSAFVSLALLSTAAWSLNNSFMTVQASSFVVFDQSNFSQPLSGNSSGGAFSYLNGGLLVQNGSRWDFRACTFWTSSNAACPSLLLAPNFLSLINSSSFSIHSSTSVVQIANNTDAILIRSAVYLRSNSSFNFLNSSFAALGTRGNGSAIVFGGGSTINVTANSSLAFYGNDIRAPYSTSSPLRFDASALVSFTVSSCGLIAANDVTADGTSSCFSMDGNTSLQNMSSFSVVSSHCMGTSSFWHGAASGSPVGVRCNTIGLGRTGGHLAQYSDFPAALNAVSLPLRQAVCGVVTANFSCFTFSTSGGTSMSGTSSSSFASSLSSTVSRSTTLSPSPSPFPSPSNTRDSTTITATHSAMSRTMSRSMSDDVSHATESHTPSTSPSISLCVDPHMPVLNRSVANLADVAFARPPLLWFPSFQQVVNSSSISIADVLGLPFAVSLTFASFMRVYAFHANSTFGNIASITSFVNQADGSTAVNISFTPVALNSAPLESDTIVHVVLTGSISVITPCNRTYLLDGNNSVVEFSIVLRGLYSMSALRSAVINVSLISGAVSALYGAAHIALQQSVMLSFLSVARCVHSTADPMSEFENPIGLTIGLADGFGQARGSIVVMFVLVLGFLVLVVVFALVQGVVLRFGVTPTLATATLPLSMTESFLRLRFPSVLLVPLTIFVLGAVSNSVLLLIQVGARDGLTLGISIGTLSFACLFLVFMFLVTTVKFCCSPHSITHTDRLRLAIERRSYFLQFFSSLFEWEGHVWLEWPSAPNFKRSFEVFFREFSVSWYAAVELLLCVIHAVGVGLRDTSDSWCKPQSILLAVAHGSGFLLVIALWPSNTSLGNFSLFVVRSLFVALSVLTCVVTFGGRSDLIDHIELVSSIGSIFLTAHSLLQLGFAVLVLLRLCFGSFPEKPAESKGEGSRLSGKDGGAEALQLLGNTSQNDVDASTQDVMYRSPRLRREGSVFRAPHNENVQMLEELLRPDEPFVMVRQMDTEHHEMLQEMSSVLPQQRDNLMIDHKAPGIDESTT